MNKENKKVGNELGSIGLNNHDNEDINDGLEDEQLPGLSDLDSDSELEWDNGEPLTPKECAALMKLSNYEQ